MKRPVFKPKPQLIEKCEHNWEIKVNMIKPQERTQEQVNMGLDYKGGRAAFKVKKCDKCKTVIYLEYKVERI